MANMSLSSVLALLVTLHMGLHLAEASPQPFQLGTPFFQSDYVNEFVMPKSCEGKTFCFEKGENYPQFQIDRLLEDMETLTVENSGQADINIGDREGDSYDEPDCPSNSTENPIYYITDENDRVRAVVQSKEKFQQIYTVKMCLTEGRIDWDTPHFMRNSRILKDFDLECVTTRMDFDFFVLSDEADPFTKPKMEIAKAKGGIPVCCKCRYK